MTLKEKLAEVCPQRVGDSFDSGVCGCPFEYEFLNCPEEKCTCVHGGDVTHECMACWDREFVPAQEKEAVNHPAHYTRYKHECIDEMIAMFGVDAVKDFCRCNAYKYRYRAGAKGDASEDLKKAEWYMDKLMQLENEGGNHA